MATVTHASLTGADLHEPKGVAAAASGTVYVADGGGSGAWQSVATTVNIVGMIADFAVPVTPTGWLECNGAAVSRTTYASLWTALSIQGDGTRTSGSPIITGIASTTNMRAGYFVGGTGIPAGTTILTVDGATQITLSANATSSGTSTVIVSPFAQGNGSTTFTLPDVYTNGKFRRSRSSTVDIGTSQTDEVKTHGHTATGSTTGTFSGTSGGQSVSHTHSGTTDSGGTDHNHGLTILGGSNLQGSQTGRFAWAASNPANDSYSTANASAYLHTHNFTTGGTNSDHTHSLSGNISATTTVSVVNYTGTETRPHNLTVMVCIKY